MEILNHGEIEKTISSYAKRKCTFVEEIISKENISFYLNSVIKRKELKPENIHSLQIFRTFDKDIFNYIVRNNDYLSENILIAKDNIRLFSLENSSEIVSGVNINDLIYRIYDSKDGQLTKTVKIQTLNISGTMVHKVILESDTANYKLCMKDNDAFYAKKGDKEYYLDNESNHDYMIDSIYKIVENECQSVIFRFNDILHNENVKEYSIKKKADKRLIMKVSKKRS